MSKANKPKPIHVSIDELRKRFYVDEEGNVRYKIATRFTSAGEIAGGLSAKEYRVITVNNKARMAHHIAWALHHGEWPDQQLDHINGIRTDNRKENLRKGTNTLNARNIKLKCTSSTGINGYHFVDPAKKYWVRWRDNGNRKQAKFVELEEAEDFLESIQKDFPKAYLYIYDKPKRQHSIHWQEGGKQVRKYFETKEEALAFKEVNDLRLKELYGYTDRHGIAA